MKFFRQTKETKRKISFFVALAMVISLLPVSPVAKATENNTTETATVGNLTVYSNVSGASVTVTSGTSVSTGEAIIKVTASKAISEASLSISITTGSAANSFSPKPSFTPAPSPIVTTASAITNAAVSINNNVGSLTTDVTDSKDIVKYTYKYNASKSDNTDTIEFKVVGIKGKTFVEISGTVTPEGEDATPTPSASADATEAPTPTPSSSSGATPTPSASSDPSATPSTCEVKVIDDNFNYQDIILKVTGVSTGSAAATVKKGDKVTFEIKPIDETKSFKTHPELKAGDDVQEWKLVSGKQYKAEITIKSDIIITISGGELLKIAVDNTVDNNAEVDGKVQGTGIKEVTIGASDNTSEEDFKKEVADMTLSNITPNTVTILDEDGNKIDITDTICEQIKSALEDKDNTQMNTALKVNVATDGAIGTAKKLANETASNKIDVTDVSDDDKKALGNDIATTVKENINERDAVILDITLESIITITGKEATTKAAIAISKLGKAIKITMDVPDKYKENGKAKNGFYYAIRIHEGKITILPCTLEENGKISFKSDRFSTYIISYADKPAPSTKPSADPSTSPSASPSGKPSTNPPSYGGGGVGGYVPTTSSTPAPSASAAPSASPSASASAAPSGSAVPSGSANPSDPSTGNTSEPTKAPGTTATQKPDNTDKDDNTNGGSTSSVKVGKKVTVSGSKYKVTAVKGTRTVQFTNGKKNAKSVVIPSTVKVSGKNYKVTTIAKNAFKGNKKLKKVTIGANVNKIGANAFKGCSKLKNIVIKTKKLTAKKVGNNAFKGINKKATFKVPKAKVKAYKKIVKAKGAGKNVKVKK